MTTGIITAADLGVPERFNAATHFVDRHLAEGRGATIAIECGDERVTHAQLAERVNRFGRALRDELDVRPEERVVLLLLDTPAFAVAFFGAIKIGAVPIPTNTLWKPADYRHVLNDSRARVAIVSEELLPQFDAVNRADVPSLRHVVVVGRTPASGGRRSFAEMLDAGLARAGGRSDLPGLARLLALFVGQHRRAQGLRAPAPRHGDLRGALRQGRARHPGTRIAASASRSSSSPMASATRSTFRSRSARPAS